MRRYRVAGKCPFIKRQRIYYSENSWKKGYNRENYNPLYNDRMIYVPNVPIIRNDKLESISVKGLYPCGEGAGYAGGIMSAAVDGIKCAEMIISKYNNE